MDAELLSLVGTIDKSLEFREHSLVAVLEDIEGAFNNIRSDFILESMRELGVDDIIFRFIGNQHCNRIIESTMGAANVCRFVHRGSPQGGVLFSIMKLGDKHFVKSVRQEIRDKNRYVRE